MASHGLADVETIHGNDDGLALLAAHFPADVEAVLLGLVAALLHGRVAALAAEGLTTHDLVEALAALVCAHLPGDVLTPAANS